MTNLNKSIKFSLLDNDYEVTFPNNGQFIEIEAMKARLTRDSYNTISSTSTVSAQLARYTVDMIAFFGTCCPKLRQDLKVDSFSELDMLSSKKILKVYVDVILPWITSWEELLNAVDEEESKD